MSNLTKSFRDSFHELKDVKALATTAMLLAIAVVLGFYTLQVTDFIKIGFAFIADEMTGMMFGPVVWWTDGSRSGYREISGTSDGSIFSGLYHQRSTEWCDLRSDSVQVNHLALSESHWRMDW